MKTLITLLILTVGASAYTKAQLYELKNLRTTGRAAKEACDFYTLKMKNAESKLKDQEKLVEDKEDEQESLWRKSSCRLKEKCDHSRKKSCYKYARTMKSLSASIKKEKSVLAKYVKEYNTNRKFADSKKKEYDAILADYLKKKEEWK